MNATYVLLNLAIIALAVIVLRLRFPRPVRVMLAPLSILLLLTLVFDNVMIQLGLFTYADTRISGIRLGLAPVEDFMYPLLAFVLTASLWQRFTNKEKSHVDED